MYGSKNLFLQVFDSTIKKSTYTFSVSTSTAACSGQTLELPVKVSGNVSVSIGMLHRLQTYPVIRTVFKHDTIFLKTIQFKAVVPACPVIDCNSPPAVNGAYVEMQGNTTTYDAVAHYTCDNRLVFGAVPGQKTAEATCQENGNWSAVIDTCQGSTCNVVIVYFSNEF